MAETAPELETYDVVVVGTGPAVTFFLRKLVDRSYKGKVAYITSSSLLPYPTHEKHNIYPAGISSEIVTGESRICLSNEWLEKNDIKVKLESPVSTFNAEEKTLVLKSGESVKYNFLILSPGHLPKSFTDIKRPDFEAKNIHYVAGEEIVENTLEKLSDLALDKKIVVFAEGSAEVGMVDVLAKKGHSITLVISGPNALGPHRIPVFSNAIKECLTKRGVTVVEGMITSCEKEEENIKNVTIQTVTGQVKLDVDVAVAALGSCSDLKSIVSPVPLVGEFVIVNHFLQTPIKDVFAIGDAILYKVFDAFLMAPGLFGCLKMANHMAKTITMKGAVPFKYTPLLLGGVGDLNYFSCGKAAGEMIVVIESPTRMLFTWIEAGFVVGVLAAGAIGSEELLLKRSVRIQTKAIVQAFAAAKKVTNAVTIIKNLTKETEMSYDFEEEDDDEEQDENVDDEVSDDSTASSGSSDSGQARVTMKKATVPRPPHPIIVRPEPETEAVSRMQMPVPPYCMPPPPPPPPVGMGATYHSDSSDSLSDSSLDEMDDTATTESGAPSETSQVTSSTTDQSNDKSASTMSTETVGEVTPTAPSTTVNTSATGTDSTPTDTSATATDTSATATDTSVTPTDTSVTPTDTSATATDTSATATDTSVTPTDTSATATDTSATPTDT